MKIVLFDIDETLLSCRESIVYGSTIMFKKVFNIDASETSINNVGKTEKGIIEEVVRLTNHYPENYEVEVPNEAYQVYAEAVASFLKTNPPKVLPGVIELLENLVQVNDILLGLLTGNSRLKSEVKLEAAKLDKYFRNEQGIIQGAFGDISNRRSDLIIEAKEKYGDGTYVLIDDSLIAAKMGQENNIPTILVATGHVPEEELRGYSKFVFKDFGEGRWKKVVEIIQSLPD